MYANGNELSIWQRVGCFLFVNKKEKEMKEKVMEMRVTNELCERACHFRYKTKG